MSFFEGLLILLVIAFGLYLRHYIIEKAKNLATKEDVASLTKVVEGVKLDFSKELEKTKLHYQLEANLKRAFQEESIKALLEINKLLVELMKYCHGKMAERQPNEHYMWSNVDDIDPKKHFHYYRVAVDKVIIENGVYLTENIKNELDNLSEIIGNLSSMELYCGNSIHEEEIEMAFDGYSQGFNAVQKCQKNLFKLLSYE